MDQKIMASMDDKLADLVKRLQSATTELESVVLYGSAARGDFHEGHSDLNILCTLRALTVKQLAEVSPVARWWTSTEKQPSPLFFTAEELRHAADVFAIELMDIKKNHRVLFGTDVVADIVVPMNLHRIQVEHELRTLLLKLRQQYVQTPSDAKTLEAVLAKSHSGVVTLVRHSLIALHKTPVSSVRELFPEIAALTGASPKALAVGLELREKGTLGGDLSAAYDAYLAALEKIILALEHHVPKSEWQRTTGAAS
jgi:predicted nucleotidyltransferase